MFGHRFFGARYFGPRYFGDGGGLPAVAYSDVPLRTRIGGTPTVDTHLRIGGTPLADRHERLGPAVGTVTTKRIGDPAK